MVPLITLKANKANLLIKKIHKTRLHEKYKFEELVSEKKKLNVSNNCPYTIPKKNYVFPCK